MMDENISPSKGFSTQPLVFVVIFVAAFLCHQGVVIGQDNVARAVMEIKFSNYTNPCGDCDLMFTFCLTTPDHPDELFSSQPCKHDKFGETRAISDSNTRIVDLSRKLPTWDVYFLHFTNPTVKLMVRVRDEEFFAKEHAFLSTTWNEQPTRSSTEVVWVPRSVTTGSGNNIHKLTFQVRSYCLENFYGSDCAVECLPPTSVQHYTCDPDTGKKVCHKGWEGPTCAENIDECSQNICENNAVCVDTPGSFVCNCLEHYSGDTCGQMDDPCQDGNCQNKGTCTPETDRYAFTCDCPAPWTGDHCEVRINPCDSNPCQNFGSCSLEPDSQDFSCICPNEWEGKVCDIKKNPCDSSPCQNSGSCYPNTDSTDFSCSCPNDWEGKICNVRKNPCDSNPCLNSGSCTAGPDNTDFTCLCSSVWEGDICDHVKDPCDPNPCRHSGTCINTGQTFETYTCECLEFWEGKSCENKRDPCAAEPCQNSGSCAPDFDTYSYTCTCSGQWEGENCEKQRQDPCESDPCLNGGKCSTDANRERYSCDCSQRYEGKRCETERNPCDTQACENGGDCTVIQPGNQYNCSCPYPYTGNRCQVVIVTTQDPTEGNVGAQGSQGNSNENGFVEWWWLLLVVALVLVLAIVLFLVMVKRRRCKKAETASVVYTNGDTVLAFDNGLYNRETTQTHMMNRQTSRDLPPVPIGTVNHFTPTANGRVNSGYLHDYSIVDEAHGAVGGERETQKVSKENCSLPEHRASLQNRDEIKGKTNDYHSFDQLKRESQMLRERQAEDSEDPGYNKLDDIVLQLSGGGEESLSQADHEEDPGYNKLDDIVLQLNGGGERQAGLEVGYLNSNEALRSSDTAESVDGYLNSNEALRSSDTAESVDGYLNSNEALKSSDTAPEFVDGYLNSYEALLSSDTAPESVDSLVPPPRADLRNNLPSVLEESSDDEDESNDPEEITKLKREVRENRNKKTE